KLDVSREVEPASSLAFSLKVRARSCSAFSLTRGVRNVKIGGGDSGNSGIFAVIRMDDILASPLPCQPTGRGHRIVSPVDGLVLPAVDRLVLGRACGNRNRLVPDAGAVRSVEPRVGEGLAASGIAPKVAPLARRPRRCWAGGREGIFQCGPSN